jgi:RND family efflux transporter MFP subunit
LTATLWFGAALLAFAAAGCNNSPVRQDSPPASSSTPSAGAALTASTPPAASPARPTEILSVLTVERQVDVRSERDGRVTEILREEGSPVEAGEVLARLDDRALQLELQKAQRDLQVAQNNLQSKEAESKAENAAYQREQQLHANGLGSQASLEAAEFRAKAADYSLAGWHAVVESSQAEIQSAKLELEKTLIRAPFAGAVVQCFLRPGEDVLKGDRCFRISQLRPLRVEFQVPESALRRPRLGDLVRVTLVGDAGRRLSARIIQMSPVVDPATDSYNVKGQLVGRDLAGLEPGMAVRVAWPPAPFPSKR